MRGLYRGMGPTVQRAAIISATQVPTYDHTKHLLLNRGLFHEGLPLHVCSSMIAGFMAAVTSSPVDVIKTRIMNQKTAGTHRPSSLLVDSFASNYLVFLQLVERVVPFIAAVSNVCLKQFVQRDFLDCIRVLFPTG